MTATIQDMIKEFLAIPGEKLEDRDNFLDRILAKELHHTDEYVMRGELLIRQHRYDKALEDLEVAASKDPDNPTIHFDLGVALSALYRQEDTISELRKAVRLDPESDTMTYALCYELERSGQYSEALGELDNLATFGPQPRREIYRHRGRILGRQGKWKKSYKNYTRSIWLPYPDEKNSNPSMFTKYREITDIRRMSRKLNPIDPSSFYGVGSHLFNSDWINASADIIGTGMLMRPEVDACLTIGYARKAVWRMRDAIDSYRDGIRQLSNIVGPKEISKIYDELIQTLVNCSRITEALECGAEAIAKGADGSHLLKYYNAIKDNPDLKETEFLSRQWDAPYYEIHVGLDITR